MVWCATNANQASGIRGDGHRLWEMSDLVAVLEEAEQPPKKRGTYKKLERAA